MGARPRRRHLHSRRLGGNAAGRRDRLGRRGQDRPARTLGRRGPHRTARRGLGDHARRLDARRVRRLGALHRRHEHGDQAHGRRRPHPHDGPGHVRHRLHRHRRRVHERASALGREDHLAHAAHRRRLQGSRLYRRAQGRRGADPCGRRHGARGRHAGRRGGGRAPVAEPGWEQGRAAGAGREHAGRPALVAGHHRRHARPEAPRAGLRSQDQTRRRLLRAAQARRTEVAQAHFPFGRHAQRFGHGHHRAEHHQRRLRAGKRRRGHPVAGRVAVRGGYGRLDERHPHPRPDPRTRRADQPVLGQRLARSGRARPAGRQRAVDQHLARRRVARRLGRGWRGHHGQRRKDLGPQGGRVRCVGWRPYGPRQEGFADAARGRCGRDLADRRDTRPGPGRAEPARPRRGLGGQPVAGNRFISAGRRRCARSAAGRYRRISGCSSSSCCCRAARHALRRARLRQGLGLGARRRQGHHAARGRGGVAAGHQH
ncbi:hypothetical protein D3C71_646270 [compost metagenome]